MFPGKDPSSLTPSEFAVRMAALKTQTNNQDPRDRSLPLPVTSPLVTSGKNMRTSSGAFHTSTIATILKSATLESAHSFGARCIPRVMRVVEMMGIEQARRWGVGGINDLRRTLGLKGRHRDRFEVHLRLMTICFRIRVLQGVE
jgi:linoleate 10R-lipoxygenase